MENKVDILVIGGSAAGTVAASTAKSKHPDKSIMLVRKEPKAVVPCGIPYIFGTLGSSEKDIMPDTGLENAGIAIRIDTVESIDKKEKIATFENGETIQFDKLVLGTGSKPFKPTWLKGAELENVFTIPKNKIYLDQLQKNLSDKKHITVVGAGFIGVEMSDELTKSGFDVTLVEIQPRILGLAFDEEIAKHAEEKLVQDGIDVKTGVGVKEILGNGKVDSVLLSDDTSFKTDAVILSMGYRPNADLAKAMGLKINEHGFISVDAYMRTSEKDIFAAGDCAEKRDFATSRLSTTMLASTAAAEARVAGLNLYSLSTYRSFKGTIGIYSTMIGNTVYGVAGITEEAAKKEGFNVIGTLFKGMDRHPGKLPGMHEQTVKLVVSKATGTILGGEVIGGESAGELINVLGVIIQTGSTINDVLTMQIGTQPMLTASPGKYPIIKAAEIASRNLNGCCAPNEYC
jgi:NADPH-dependent 2,4-dienoyl-CoA reductase/sulfur reductase-like enzyme